MKHRTAQEAARYLLEREIPLDVLEAINKERDLHLSPGTTFKAALDPEISKYDGYSSVSERQSNGRRVSSVGVSIQALCYSRDYRGGMRWARQEKIRLGMMWPRSLMVYGQRSLF